MPRLLRDAIASYAFGASSSTNSPCTAGFSVPSVTAAREANGTLLERLSTAERAQFMGLLTRISGTQSQQQA
ncbi:MULTISPECIES: hypothetical protein [Streptomyces]|uniref:hypothetical protein n=1 Tax=Streptomyces TaxID=1883 RepID=UPI0035A17B11